MARAGAGNAKPAQVLVVPCCALARDVTETEQVAEQELIALPVEV